VKKYRSKEARKRELVEKADAALRSIYSVGDIGTVTCNNVGWLNVGSQGYDPFSTNPLRVYDDGTTGGSLSANSGFYVTGVNHDITASGTLDTTATISFGSSVTLGTSATDVTSSNIIINPTYNWPVIQQDNLRRANDAGLSVDEFYGASDWVPGAVAANANIGIDWATNIVVNPAVPQDEVWLVNDEQILGGGVQSFVWQPLDKRQRLRQQMMPKREPCRADGVSFQNCTPAELTALSLLKKMVDEPGWRTYLKYGFVNVRGHTGLDYQIRRGHWHVLVRNQGKRVAELCVGLSQRSRMPPTDEVIARLIMAECDEPELWRRANVDIVAERRRYYSNPQNHEHMQRLVA
jgi:hypothetical protein